MTLVPVSRDPRALLPLTPLVFQVLLALATEPRHGYGIIRDVDDRTDGLIRLRTGTLYVLLQRLVKASLLEVLTTAPSGAGTSPTPGSPRRYYRLTAFGRAVLSEEAKRLAAAVSDARRQRVLRRDA